ncbi:Antitoxin HigA-2 [Pontiella desulfatans]|jgi:putative transcriptional regulator|uniref:Antitoxin HigA-2 n=1 Tax=Pontiella desulfatans TaxID=2750659 RepID=A0A6C2U8K5_PONDE|nr:XRE family transcriptional regulator [Pontiella desulfatans]VGO15744.1 Antitoxin HigA-2 [Pontiella desulfatans]
MKDKLFDELKESLGEVLDHAQGKITLKSKDVVMPDPPRPVTAKEVVRIRRKVGASQAVFAKMLNVARDTEISWEQGRRTPSGAALRLLRIAESHPEHLLQH